MSGPFISRHTLCVAVFAFTCVSRCLVEGITASILVLRGSDIAPWVRKLSSQGATCMGEADCKERFKRIKPATAVQELRDASQYLYHKKRWGAVDIIWCVHRDCKALDGAGKAASASFWHFSHKDLVEIVRFSLTKDNHIWCSGTLWQHSDAIPLGGSFTAQCADVCSVWAFQVAVDKMRHFGRLVQTAPVLLWKTPCGNIVTVS